MDGSDGDGAAIDSRVNYIAGYCCNALKVSNNQIVHFGDLGYSLLFIALIWILVVYGSVNCVVIRTCTCT